MVRCPSSEIVSAVRLTNKTETGCKHSHQKRNTHQIRKKKSDCGENKEVGKELTDKGLSAPRED